MESTKTIYLISTKTVTVFLNFKGVQESIPPAYVAWWAGTTTLILGSLPPYIVLKFQHCISC